MWRLASLAILAVLVGSGELGAQAAPAPAAATHPIMTASGSLAATPAPPLPELLRTPGGAFAASLLLPGAGQAALGLRRWLVYGVLEVGLWAVHLEAAADVRSLTTAYRDLAWEAARQPTGPTSRQDGGWSYYETMSHYLASGAFDLDPRAPGVQPEQDLSTYNGTVWDLARGLYLGTDPEVPTSPGYQAALDYYRDRAAGPDFLWSWVGQPAELDRFRDLIHDADSEARVRSTALGLVLANHLVSAVDAFVVSRLRAETAVRLDSRLVPANGTLRWRLALRIPVQD